MPWPGRWRRSKEDGMEQRKELVTERHDLPSRFWEPEPPEDWEPERDPEEQVEDPPFE